MNRLQWLAWCHYNNLGEWGRVRQNQPPAWDFARWKREFAWNKQARDPKNDTAMALSA